MVSRPSFNPESLLNFITVCWGISTSCVLISKAAYFGHVVCNLKAPDLHEREETVWQPSAVSQLACQKPALRVFQLHWWNLMQLVMFCKLLFNTTSAVKVVQSTKKCTHRNFFVKHWNIENRKLKKQLWASGT